MPSVPDDVARFRANYRGQNVGRHYRGWLHFAFTSTASLLAVVLAAAQVSAVRPWEWLTIPVGFLVANLAEYLGHRGPMHHPVPGLRLLHRRHTLEHHRFFVPESMAVESTEDFTATLFPWYMVLFFLGAIAAPLAALLFLVTTANVGWLFCATAVGYFLCYEWLHFTWHQPDDGVIGRLRAVRFLRRHHRLHHDRALMTKANFNITFPIWDIVLSSNVTDSSAQASAQAQAASASAIER